MSLILTTTDGGLTLQERDESDLLKTEGVIDNDVERTVAVEYCLAGCAGQAHVTGTPDGPGCFCSQHVHRSVHVHLKRGIDVFGIAGSCS